jgi:hypothetical protein
VIEIMDRLTRRAMGTSMILLFESSVAITSGARHSLEPKGAEAVHLGAISAPGALSNIPSRGIRGRGGAGIRLGYAA